MTDRSMSLRIVTAVLVALLGSTAACSGDSALDTAGDPVVFGEGERPPAIPGDFPIPGNAVIGSTMIDRTNHRTEMALQVGSDLEATVQYFNVGLVSQGYVVGASHGTATSWTISFSRGELNGEIDFTAAGDATQVLVSVNEI
ncbi:MAG: hypothetical protein A2135_10730 [Actinobacteria bacterium RBG_16_67_15]|jgi:hypothetical protein|nr:MAG: hypothetical protein A2135_10730 [Actinobacteria bacterium RBG_16_67_15]